jgi:hypothetical protein
MIVNPDFVNEIEIDIFGYKYTNLEFTDLFEIYFQSQELFDGFSLILSEIFHDNNIISSNNDETSIDFIFKYYSTEIKNFNSNFSNYYAKLGNYSLIDFIQKNEEIEDQY